MPERVHERRIVVLAPAANDASAIAALLQGHGLTCGIAGSPREAHDLIEGGAGVLLLTEEALEMANADALLETLKSQPAWSELPVTILTSGGPKRLIRLLDIASLAPGSVGLVERPVNSELLLRSVQVALSARQRQYQVRDLLEDQKLRQLQLEGANRLAMERLQSVERALEERDRAEAKAAEGAERLRVAIKDSRLMLAQCDSELRYTWIHHSRPEFARNSLGRRDDEIDDSDASRRLTALKRQVIETGIGVEADITFPRSEGVRTYSFTLEPLHNEQGALIGVTSASLDITDRKRIEDALRDSEARVREQFVELEAIYRNAPFGFALFDRDLRFRRINELLAGINGRPIRDHIGKTVGEVIPQIGAHAEEMLHKVIDSASSIRSEFTADAPARPGEERIWDERWHPLLDPSGKVTSVILVLEDVTERRRNEEALRQSEATFRALAENLPQLAWMTTADGRRFWFNRRWYDYTGATLGEMQGWGWHSLHHPDHRERTLATYRRSLETGTPWEDTFPIRAKDGHYRWFLTRSFPIRDAAGQITRWFGTNTDITLLRDTQDALREAQKKIREYANGLEKTVAERTSKLQETVQDLEAFSYSVAHDMRAPLRSMMGFAQILHEEHAKELGSEAHDYLRRITASARRLDGLIQDVLNYSRIVRQNLPLEPIDVHALIAEVMESYPNLSSFRNCVHVATRIPWVVGNRAALTQVLSNLLANAVKFVPKNVTPSVRIYGERSRAPGGGEPSGQGWATIWVEDNGIGIDSEVRTRLFQMFQRFTRPGLYEGTGMGLAIARKAIERMGGTIGVEPSAPTGSRFWFSLPVAHEAHHPVEATKP